jgi:hypothetical protein
MTLRSIVLATCVVALAVLPAAADTPGGNKELAAAHYKLGSTLFDQGRYDEAYTEFEQAYQLAPRPLVIYHMARARQHAGKLDEALTLYRRYLEQEPNGKGVDDAKAQIAAITKQQDEKAAEAAKLAAAAAATTSPTTGTTSTGTTSTGTTSTGTTSTGTTSTGTTSTGSTDTTTGTATPHATSDADGAAKPDLRPDHVVASVSTDHDSDSSITGGSATAPEGQPRAVRWPWIAAAVGALALGIVLDTAPSSARDHKLEALDFAPIGCYGLAAVSTSFGLGWL